MDNSSRTKIGKDQGQDKDATPQRRNGYRPLLPRPAQSDFGQSVNVSVISQHAVSSSWPVLPRPRPDVRHWGEGRSDPGNGDRQVRTPV